MSAVAIAVEFWFLNKKTNVVAAITKAVTDTSRETFFEYRVKNSFEIISKSLSISFDRLCCVEGLLEGKATLFVPPLPDVFPYSFLHELRLNASGVVVRLIPTRTDPLRHIIAFLQAYG